MKLVVARETGYMARNPIRAISQQHLSVLSLSLSRGKFLSCGQRKSLLVSAMPGDFLWHSEGDRLLSRWALNAGQDQTPAAVRSDLQERPCLPSFSSKALRFPRVQWYVYGVAIAS